jgi:hypothetical protein
MQVGRTCTMNINTGTFASPTWSAAGRISSPTINMARPASRKVYRESPNSKNVLGVRDMGFSFTYIVRGIVATDAVLTLLLNSFHNDSVIDMAALDRAAGSGARGIRGPFQVSQINKNEDDEDAVSYDVTVVEVEDDVNANFHASPYTIT